MLNRNTVKMSSPGELPLKSSESAVILLASILSPGVVPSCIVASNTYANDRKQESPVPKYAISALTSIRQAPTFVVR